MKKIATLLVLLASNAAFASYTLFSVVDFGAGRSGLSTVGYKVYTQSSNTLGSRITTGVQEIGATGKYGAVVTFADGFVGGVLWDSGETTPVYAMDVQNPQTGEYVDAKVSTRSTYAGADTNGTTTLLGRLTSGRATNLDNLDATVSSRSTYAGGAVASVTADVGITQAGADKVWSTTTRALTDKVGFSLSQAFPANFAVLSINSSGNVTASLTSFEHTTFIDSVKSAMDQQGYTLTRSALLDHLNADVTSRMATFTLPTNFSALTITSGKVDVNDKTGFALTSAYDQAKIDILNVTLPAGYTGQKAGSLLWRAGNHP